MIFIGGLGRSGTTLLERLLGEIPGVIALGEVVHLWARGVIDDEPCGCGEPFSECSFWHKVGARAFGGWRARQAESQLDLRARVDRTRRLPLFLLGMISREAHLATYVSTYARVYTAATEIADGRTVVDSSKHASLAYCLASILDLHVVHVIRDPRAVAASWRQMVRRPEDGHYMARWSPWRTALHWMVQNLAFELLSMRGVRVTRVRYEDLVADPETTLRDLAAALRLPSSPEALSFVEEGHAQLGVAHTVSGNPMRFALGRVAITDHPADLAAAQRRLVTALTLPLLLRYGYRIACQRSSPCTRP
ncbi:sulfotransferase [Streptosporangiaceae bacterium NEAU-GS5]|nr:sulfotransferase [Streptosporangiaceae bacterium NEAU-GS5]